MDLYKLKWDILLKEGITKEDLELVDLDIGYSPVIPIKGGQPMEAIRLESGKFRVPECPIVGLNISEEELTIMRYRYLNSR